ncbi:MAG TPA: hypothetical protein VFA24_04850 [Gaiellaceae bacterium]|nr:hypothetical protein [Gaiellaceae bacterium]
MLALLAVAATVLTGCTHQPQVRPAKVVFACADFNFYATNLHWSRWSATEATGTGTGHQNDCRPNCAAGKFVTFRIAVTLTRPVTCVKGRREFSKLAWRFTSKKLPHSDFVGSETLNCKFLRLKP